MRTFRNSTPLCPQTDYQQRYLVIDPETEEEIIPKQRSHRFGVNPPKEVIQDWKKNEVDFRNIRISLNYRDKEIDKKRVKEPSEQFYTHFRKVSYDEIDRELKQSQQQIESLELECQLL